MKNKLHWYYDLESFFRTIIFNILQKYPSLIFLITFIQFIRIINRFFSLYTLIKESVIILGGISWLFSPLSSSMSHLLIGGCNFILSVEWFRNSSSDGHSPSSRPLRIIVLISRTDIEPVYYVTGDRSRDRSLGKVAGHFYRWTWE